MKFMKRGESRMAPAGTRLNNSLSGAICRYVTALIDWFLMWGYFIQSNYYFTLEPQNST